MRMLISVTVFGGLLAIAYTAENPIRFVEHAIPFRLENSETAENSDFGTITGTQAGNEYASGLTCHVLDRQNVINKGSALHWYLWHSHNATGLSKQAGSECFGSYG